MWLKKRMQAVKKWQANKTTYRDMQEILRDEKMYMAKSISHLFGDYVRLQWISTVDQYILIREYDYAHCLWGMSFYTLPHFILLSPFVRSPNQR